MYNLEEIIEKYRSSDSEHRLSLFLQYPPLRDIFTRIDQGEWTAAKESQGQVGEG